MDSQRDEGKPDKMEIVFIPSPADAFVDSVFPQWPIDKEIFTSADLLDLENDEQGGISAEELPRWKAFLSRITVLPNPATFVLGDIAWAASSVDALFHINAEEASRAPVGERPDRVAALATHLLEQRSFYPLYPAAPPDVPGGGVPLELPQVWHAGMSCAPDVLISPTRVGKPCVRVLGGTVVINPGALSRNKSFARVCVFPRAKTTQKPGDADFDPYVPNNAPSRVRVDVDKLNLT